MKDSNKSILKTNQAISDMTGARATAKEELSMAKTDFSQTMTELEGLNDTNGDLHKSCDYVLKNFDARQRTFLVIWVVPGLFLEILRIS